MRSPQNSFPALVNSLGNNSIEAKQYQKFGGDSLKLSHYEQKIDVPANTNYKKWRVIMTPENKDYTLPLLVELASDGDDGQTGSLDTHFNDDLGAWIYETEVASTLEAFSYYIDIIYTGQANFKFEAR